jgi:hypothetical protein
VTSVLDLLKHTKLQNFALSLRACPTSNDSPQVWQIIVTKFLFHAGLPRMAATALIWFSLADGLGLPVWVKIARHDREQNLPRPALILEDLVKNSWPH